MDTNEHFTVASLGFTTHTAPSHQSISDRAHAIWRKRGRPSGDDLAIWLQAERQLGTNDRKPARSIRERLRDGYSPVLGRSRSATSL